MAEEVEIWRSLEEFPNYQISTFGRVKNIKTGTVLKPASNKRQLNGNFNLSIAMADKTGVKHVKGLPTLIATMFLPKTNDAHIHFIDGNTENLKISNMRWGPNPRIKKTKKAASTNSSTQNPISEKSLHPEITTITDNAITDGAEQLRISTKKRNRHMNYDIIPDIIHDCIGKGVDYFFKAIGTFAVKSRNSNVKFLKVVTKQISDGKYPWFNGTADDLWELIYVKDEHGNKIRSIKQTTDILVKTTARDARVRKHIMKEKLHRNSAEFPEFIYCCDVCGIKGHDEGYAESYWLNKTSEKFEISGGNPETTVIATVKLCLDHRDGDRTNNLQSNLRWLCYNCDPFTPFFNIGLKNPARNMDMISKEQNRLLERFNNDTTCELCHRSHWDTKIDDTWHKFIIPLEIDHINGNHKDNDSYNKRRICRQCHANTPTYTKRKGEPKQKKQKQ